MKYNKLGSVTHREEIEFELGSSLIQSFLVPATSEGATPVPGPMPAHSQLLGVLLRPADAVPVTAAAQPRAGGAHRPSLGEAEPAQGLSVLGAQLAWLGPQPGFQPQPQSRLGLRPGGVRGRGREPDAGRSTCRRCRGRGFSCLRPSRPRLL
ncbi:hypothetical protein HispidOSU_027262 [Sigmodon hispidus]